MHQYELNIALNGFHYALVDFRNVSLEDAQAKATQISNALRSTYPNSNWSFHLIRWTKTGKPITLPHEQPKE